MTQDGSKDFAVESLLRLSDTFTPEQLELLGGEDFLEQLNSIKNHVAPGVFGLIAYEGDATVSKFVTVAEDVDAVIATYLSKDINLPHVAGLTLVENSSVVVQIGLLSPHKCGVYVEGSNGFEQANVKINFYVQTEGADEPKFPLFEQGVFVSFKQLFTMLVKTGLTEYAHCPECNSIWLPGYEEHAYNCETSREQ